MYVAKLAGLQRLGSRTDTIPGSYALRLFVKFVSVECPRIDTDSICICIMTACLAIKQLNRLMYYTLHVTAVYIMRAI